MNYKTEIKAIVAEVVCTITPSGDGGRTVTFSDNSAIIYHGNGSWTLIEARNTYTINGS
jgi:hypothetical protein